MTHCLCKPLIQGLVELRLFSLFFPCVFSSPTKNGIKSKVISTKLTAGKLWLPTFLKPKLYSSQAKRTTFPHSLNACFPLRTWMISFPVPYSLSSFSFIDLKQLLLERTVDKVLQLKTERSCRNARPISFIATKDEFDPLVLLYGFFFYLVESLV